MTDLLFTDKFMDIITVAACFVDDQDLISRYSIAKQMVSHEIERNLRQKHIDAMKKHNLLRLLFLTKNLSEADYAIQGKAALDEVNRFSELIWPPKTP